ncbi:MAG TPA: GGDEF domain-containing protein, partial [Egibacteraceae bacterium]|nr:GGDEF domain-containing protein [Egibacteraceae bacterium]
MGPGAQVRVLRGDAERGPREWAAGVVPALSAALAAALLWLWLFAQPGYRRPVTAVVNALVMVVLVAVTASLVRLRDLGPGERRAWRTFLTAFLLFSVSSSAGAYVQLAPEQVPSWLPTLRQVVVVSGFGVMVLALFRLPAAPVRGLAKARFALDTVTIFASSTIFLWHFVIAPALRARGMTGREAVVVVVAVGFMAVFVGALSMLLLRERTPGTREALIRLVVGVALVFGVIVASLTAHRPPAVPGPLWSTALTWFAYVLVISAAVQQRRHVMGSEVVDRDVEHRALLALPYVAVALAFAFLLFAGLREAPLELRGVLVSASVVGVCVLIRQRLLLHENELLRRRLVERASHDDLTGLRNRGSWEAEAEREVARARRNGHPLSVLVLDVDDFKTVNDQYGHAAGDLVLRAVGQALREGVRTADLPARLGGDEFVVLLPDTGLEDAVHLAQAVCRRIERLDVPEAANVAFTVSVGAASMPPASSVRGLVAVADSAMYAAKRDGRNRVRSAESPLSVLG